MSKRHILLAAVLFAGPVWAEDPAKPETSQDPQSQSTPTDNAQTAGSKQEGTCALSEADAQRVLSKSTAAALEKGQLQRLSQQFSQADQERLGGLSDQGQQVDQSIAQLNQAFKDKYQQDLSFGQNAGQIFTAQFFGRTDDLGENAQTAAARQAPDNATPEDPAAGAATDEQRDEKTVAKPADSTITGNERAVLHIPKSQSDEETTVALVKEGGEWKIDLPDSIDAKQLAQNLQKHVDLASQEKEQWGADAADAQRSIARHILMAFADDKASASDAVHNPGDKSDAAQQSDSSRENPNSDGEAVPQR